MGSGSKSKSTTIPIGPGTGYAGPTAKERREGATAGAKARVVESRVTKTLQQQREEKASRGFKYYYQGSYHQAPPTQQQLNVISKAGGQLVITGVSAGAIRDWASKTKGAPPATLEVSGRKVSRREFEQLRGEAIRKTTEKWQQQKVKRRRELRKPVTIPIRKDLKVTPLMRDVIRQQQIYGTTPGALPSIRHKYSGEIQEIPEYEFRGGLYGGGIFVPKEEAPKPITFLEKYTPYSLKKKAELERQRKREEAIQKATGWRPEEKPEEIILGITKPIGIETGWRPEEVFTPTKEKLKGYYYEKEYPTEWTMARKAGALGVTSLIGWKASIEAAKMYGLGLGVGKIAKIPKLTKAVIKAEKGLGVAAGFGITGQFIRDPVSTIYGAPEIIGGGLGYAGGRQFWTVREIEALTTQEIKGIKKGLNPSQLKQFNASLKIMKKLRKQKSTLVRDVTLEGSRIPEAARVKLLDYIKKEKALVYGSVAAKTQIPGKARTPRDIDIAVLDPFKASRDLLQIVNKAAGKKVAKLDKDRKGLLDIATGKHIVDIHSLSQFKSRFYPGAPMSLGLKPGRPLLDLGLYPRTKAGIKVMPLREQLLRKGTTIFYPGQEYRRFKDIGDFLKIGKVLITEKKLRAKKLPTPLKQYQLYQAELIQRQFDIFKYPGRKQPMPVLDLGLMPPTKKGKRGIGIFREDITGGDIFMGVAPGIKKAPKKPKIYKYPKPSKLVREYGYFGGKYPMGEYPRGGKLFYPFYKPTAYPKKITYKPVKYPTYKYPTYPKVEDIFTYPKPAKPIKKPRRVVYPKARKVITPGIFRPFTENILTRYEIEQQRRRKQRIYRFKEVKRGIGIYKPTKERKGIAGYVPSFFAQWAGIGARVPEKKLKGEFIFTGLEIRPIPIFGKPRKGVRKKMAKKKGRPKKKR